MKRGIGLGGAWLAWMTGLTIDGALDGPAAVAIAALAGAALVLLGFAAASRCRPLPPRTAARRARLAAAALAVGGAVGLANMASNWAIAASNPSLRQLLSERMARVAPITGIVAAPLVEEIAMRLFLMSAIVWVVLRVTKRPGRAFAIGLLGSSLVFAALHLARPLPIDPALANAYRTALLAKYTMAGIPLGWIFWRWGLPYSMLCHAAANAAHMAVQSRVF